ncbi:MAG: hypothetical protein IT559_07975 [Alphaproteobacteria bacterium]|nr:hypothetical protein [Alphaproteobacteria bacterium]
MFWSKKKQKQEEKPVGRSADSAALRAQALATMRTARAEIGEETLQKIAAAIQRKQNSPIEQAKARIHQADADRVADELFWMMGKRD